MHRPMQDTACGEHETLVLLREIAEGADMVHMAGPCAKTDGPFWTRFAPLESPWPALAAAMLAGLLLHFAFE